MGTLVVWGIFIVVSLGLGIQSARNLARQGQPRELADWLRPMYYVIVLTASTAQVVRIAVHHSTKQPMPDWELGLVSFALSLALIDILVSLVVRILRRMHQRQGYRNTEL